MKVLQISKYYYPYIGGIEQVARDIADVLRNNNIEQMVICFNEDSSNGEYETHKKETIHDVIDGVEVVRCGCQMKVSSQALSASYSKELKTIINNFNPDIVIFHYPNPYAAHFVLKYIKENTKLYIYWHLDITKQKILGKLFHYQNIRLIKRADKIIGATTKHLDESAYTKYFEGKKYLIPYRIDEDSLAITDKEIKKAESIRQKYSGKVLGFFIGRHVPYKGLKYLIEASKLLDDENIHFFIAGKGELTDELKTQAKGDSKIEFIGPISASDKRAYLYATDIICFPSITKNEGFGLALAEGMYFGKPAVTFTIPGSGVNIVNLDGVTGIECPNADSAAYANALNKLLKNPDLRKLYGNAARKRILDNYTKIQFEQNVMTLLMDAK